MMKEYNGFTPQERIYGDKIIKNAIRRGVLPPLNKTKCAICGQDKGVRHYHTEDYTPSRILDEVVPLCWRCHMHIHSNNKNTENWKRYEIEVVQGNGRWKPVYTKWWKD